MFPMQLTLLAVLIALSALARASFLVLVHSLGLVLDWPSQNRWREDSGLFQQKRIGRDYQELSQLTEEVMMDDEETIAE